MDLRRWWGLPRKQRIRSRIADDCRQTGRVLVWKSHFGWITPDCEIDHPEAWKHGRRVYVNVKDVTSGKPLPDGSRVSFVAYCDGDGIGAEDVWLEETEQPPQEEEERPAVAEAPEAEPEPEVPENSNEEEMPRKRFCGGQGLLEDKINGDSELETPPRPPEKCKGKGRGKAKGRGRGPCSFGGLGPDRTKTTTSGGGSVLAWVSSEMQGWRPAMEDAGCALLGLDVPLENHAMFAIFDGHGGSAVSRRASQELPAQITAAAAADALRADPAALAEAEDGGDGGLAGRALKVAIPAMDAILREAGDGRVGYLPTLANGQTLPCDVRNEYALTGSTLVVALLECAGPPEVRVCQCHRVARPTRLVVAHCGDSRAIVCRDGEAIALTQDHKPDDPEERERIQKAGGSVTSVGPCMRIDGWGLNLSRALGDFHYKARDDLDVSEQKVSVVPDVRTFDITDQDEFLLLACDGVFELHSCQEAVDHIRERLRDQASLAEAVESLVDASCSEDLLETQGRGSDNVSAMVIMLR